MSSLNEPPVLGAGQQIGTRLKGWFFGAAMLLSAFFGVLYIVTPLVVLLFLKPRLWRQMLDRLVGIWVIMPGALCNYIFGANIRIKGDFINHEEPALIIMNHRTRLDWLFFWNALYKMDPWLCTTEKISLKGMLKYVPGAGWAMQAASYIFLDRSFDTDKTKLDNILNYYAETEYKYQLLLFPEGTDKCPKATERSRIHSEKKGLVHYQYVLHPRVTGFVHIVQAMRRANNIKYIYDVSIGFGDAIVQSELDIFAHGVCPKEVFYQVIKYPIEAIPQTDEALGQWLVNLWRNKEEKLKRFYEMPRNVRQFPDTPDGVEYELDNNTDRAQKGLIGFWCFTTVFWMFMFFESAFMFYWAIIACVFYAAVHKFYGGLEFLAIDRFNHSKQYGVVGQEPEVLNT
ncbi:Phospholipid/glycerol acyltransferase domain-containing protein [Caenorhabditis elegans]|uniref:Phospholipid/glycerol acyltransferase domain-containing protein n=1 Tax=Caenorhabditis elegans TaxID=6239 RepID=Q23087_CAEEL|nr:Phospholipid/glycerol acyltransferase domain-containing protein [Caenorhabditis elegans]CCD74362.1 Phospholipid/glycerol acyltransferase domain-containing protein [Caenorhabditis elegans]|eukprot:NP_504644.1 ACyLtransferase-like [Caenorhabditis elegans]